MLFKRKKRIFERIEITPLIDVVFCLLIFLLITMSFEKAAGIKIDLPKASTDNLSQEKRVFKITITKDEKIVIGEKKQEISIFDLERKLRELHIKDPKLLIVIQADKTVSHGQVVFLMDLVKKAKFRRIAIATLRGKEASL